MVKIKFKNTLIRDFNENDINKNFLNALNNKRLNKFISTKHLKRKLFSSFNDTFKAIVKIF